MRSAPAPDAIGRSFRRQHLDRSVPMTSFMRPYHPLCQDEAQRRNSLAAIGILVIGLGLLCSGCSSWLGPPAEIRYDSADTRQLMDRLVTANADLAAVKGVGRVTITTRGTQRIYERTAWVAAEPGRLRFAFRAPTGMPVLSMSCDAMWVTALSHVDGQYYRREIGDNSLSRFLPVSVKCVDLYSLMMGRPPRIAYDEARLESRRSEDDAPLVVVLQRRFRGTVGRIRIDPHSGELEAVELMDIHGNRLYLARVETRQTVEGYRLPTRLSFSGPDGSLILEASRLWPEASVSEDLFRIEPPPSN
jgi:hypothetical protein